MNEHMSELSLESEAVHSTVVSPILKASPDRWVQLITTLPELSSAVGIGHVG